jgi:hypothetical protein
MKSFGRGVETAELDYRGQRRELISTKACLIHAADPPSSAVSNENPPRRLRTCGATAAAKASESRKLVAV